MVHLSRYVPDYIAAMLHEAGPLQELRLPLVRTERMGVLFTDVSSFTRLTIQVSKAGHYGVEIIIDILNQYFEEMLACIHRFGGTLIKFGGDSLLSLFPGGMGDSIPRMLATKNAMKEALGTLNETFDRRFGIRINFHGGMSWGDITVNIVGNRNYHLDYYLVGEALAEAFELGEEAGAGEIALPDRFRYMTTLSRKTFQRSTFPAEYAALFMPDAVQRKIGEMKFSAELRNAAVLFISLRDAAGGDVIDFEAYQKLYFEIQKRVYEMDGTVNKIDCNDKSYLILATFGIPFIHTDDIERAFICSYRILKIPCESIELRIGVTYSNIYAGILGASTRCEYGIIGDAVNKAARLMTAAQFGEIAFSGEMLPRIKDHFETVFDRMAKAKGIPDEIAIHKLVRERPESWVAFESRYKERRLVAFHSEVEWLQSLFVDSPGSLAIITGDAGVGKSFVLYRILSGLIEDGKHCDLAILEEYSQAGQLEYIRRILERKLGISDLLGDFPILDQYCRDHGLIEDTSLIRQFLESVARGEETENADVDLICDNLSDILAEVFAGEDVVAIENAMWLDYQSRKVLEHAVPKMRFRKTGLLLTTRDPKSLLEITRYDHRLLELRTLNLDEAGTLIRHILTNVTNDAIEALYQITGGNALFVQEMCAIIEKNFDFSGKILNAANVHLLVQQGVIPETVENLFIGQYESLDEDARHVLKIASIVGRAFSIVALNIVGADDFSQEVVRILKSLNMIKVIDEKNINPEIEYAFSNNFMRDAIYKIIPMMEKRSLHNKIATFYEERHKSNLHPWYELIANHYIQAENRDKACQYCRLAGEKTYGLAAYTDSSYYYGLAMEYAREESQKLEMDLKLIDIDIFQGNVTDATERLGRHKPQDYPTPELRDHFRYLNAKVFTITWEYGPLHDYLSRVLDDIETPFHRKTMHSLYLDALRGLGRFDEFEKKSLEAYEDYVRENDTGFIGKLSSIIGQFYLDRSDYANARKYYQVKMEISEETGDQIGLRMALTSIGNILKRTGEKDEAMEYYKKALTIAERIGDKNGTSKVLGNMAAILQEDQREEDALQLYQKSLVLSMLVGNQLQQETVQYNIGSVYFWQQKYDEALPYFLDALELAKKLNDYVGIGYAVDAIGDVYLQQGKIEEAEKLYYENLELQQKIGDREAIAHTYGNLGNVAKAVQQFDKAIQWYDKQYEICGEVGDMDGCGRSRFNSALVRIDQNRYRDAIPLMEQAKSFFERCRQQRFVEYCDQTLEELRKELDPGTDG